MTTIRSPPDAVTDETLPEFRDRMAKLRFLRRVEAARRLRDVPPEVTFRAYGELVRVGRELARLGEPSEPAYRDSRTRDQPFGPPAGHNWIFTGAHTGGEHGSVGYRQDNEGGDDLKGTVKLKAVVHESEEGGFWGEVPAIPGCATQGETIEELLQNLHEAIEGCLGTDPEVPEDGRILEIAI